MDGIIDIVIAILFIAIPTIFKAIGNKLEKSGKAEKAGKLKKIAQTLSDEDDKEQNFEEWVMEQLENPTEEPVVVQPVVEETIKTQEVKKPKAKIKAAILLEEDNKKNKEKIDPKKLVIYSEIMNRKF